MSTHNIFLWRNGNKYLLDERLPYLELRLKSFRFTPVYYKHRGNMGKYEYMSFFCFCCFFFFFFVCVFVFFLFRSFFFFSSESHMYKGVFDRPSLN